MSPRRSALDPAVAFRQHVVPEIDVLLRVARSITRNPHDAEDLVQETLVRAYRGIQGFDGRHPRAWLLTILRNTQINTIRRRRPVLLHDPDAPERLASRQGGGLEPEHVVLAPMLDDDLERAVEELPEPFRAVVELVDLGRLTYEEAATMLDVPIGTVMSRLHRARTRLRAALEHRRPARNEPRR